MIYFPLVLPFSFPPSLIVFSQGGEGNKEPGLDGEGQIEGDREGNGNHSSYIFLFSCPSFLLPL